MERAAGQAEPWLRILGPVEIYVAGRPVPLSGLQRALAVALATHAGSVVSTDRLVFSLWGDDFPRSSHNRVQALVSDIRRRVSAAGGPADLIETAPPGYRLRTAAVRLDVADFDQLAGVGRIHAANSRLAEAAASFSEALGLWQGPIADGVELHDRDFAAFAGRLSESRLQAIEGRAEALLELGAPGELVAELRAMVDVHPLRERLRGLLMKALARTGRTAEALETYRAGFALTVEELGTEPSEALQQLHYEILQGEQGMPAETKRRPAQLPPRVRPFVGRESYLRDLDAMVTSAGHSAVVITTLEGTGGIGKTALAVEWAHHVAGNFPDGQLYLNLHGYSSNSVLRPAEALAKLLTGLGVSPAAIPGDEEAAAALFRTKITGQRLLILLDNAANPSQIRPLLPAEPGCLAIITSRDRFTGLLASHGAHRILVDVLPRTEALALLASLAGSERIAAEPEAADRLVDACSRLPLALRIVAARISDDPHTTLMELAQDLQGPRGLGAMLVEGDLQMSVRSVIGQSYSQLDLFTSQVFELMALIPGPDATAAAIAGMSGLPETQVLQALDALVRACLVEQSDERYSLHDVVRLYGHEQAVQRHSEHACRETLESLSRFYSQHIDAAAKLLYPQTLRLDLPSGWDSNGDLFASMDEAMAWLEAERRNLVAAVHWAAKDPIAWILADGLNGFFWIRRHMADWLRTSRTGLEAAVAQGNPRAEAAMNIVLGQARRAAGEYAASGQHFDEANRLAVEAGWPEAEARALSNRAIVYAELGMLPQAAAGLQQGLEVDRRIGRVAGEAVGLLNLGSLRLRMGELRTALADISRAREIYHQIGAPGGEAMCLLNLGLLCRELGRLADSESFLHQAITLAERINDRYADSWAHICRAYVLLDREEHADALSELSTAEAIAGESADPKTQSIIKLVESEIRREMGDTNRSREAVVLAQDLAGQIDDDFGKAEVMVALARLEIQAGQTPAALDIARKLDQHATQQGYRFLRAHARSAMAEAYQAAGNNPSARQWAVTALGAYRSVGHRLGEAKMLQLLSALETERGVAFTDRLWSEALTIYRELGIPTNR